MQITPPQNPLARSTPSDDVNGTISRIAVTSSPAPMSFRWAPIPAGIVWVASGGIIPASFITPAKIISPPSTTCSPSPAIRPYFLDVAIVSASVLRFVLDPRLARRFYPAPPREDSQLL